MAFGTDGWRAIIADDYTFENVRVCAQAFAEELLTDRGERGCVIAYDNRFASEHFADAVAEVMAGNGVRVILCRPGTPTPVLSFSIIDRAAAGGVIITASHNPAIWNGFKVRGDYGGAAAPETLTRLEARIAAIQSGQPPRRLAFDDATRQDLIEIYDAGPRYEAKVRSLLDTEFIRDRGLTIVHDAMYGVGAGWIERLVGGGRTRVIPVNAERNPIFPGINPEPISRNLGGLLDGVQANHADLGIATDGDSDRLGLADERGEFIDQLRAYSLIVLYLLEVRGLRGPIVKTLSTSTMLDRLGEQYGVPVHETGVGFKFVAPKMVETNAIVGGEESGGYAFGNHIPERDGIVAGLYIADMMARLGKRPSELVEYLFSKAGTHFYDRADVDFPADKRADIVARLTSATPDQIGGERVVRSQTTDGFKWISDRGSWLLIRFSGTEPIMRVYTETGDQAKVQRILDQGRELAGV
ncbi:MAG: phosphoglucomutase/phosphomannomutase family protein [Chloroflexota bacterium]|nr:MAG: phosphoglucomutase/phosphomannomutase family protein [Chloroflexota bacterium]